MNWMSEVNKMGSVEFPKFKGSRVLMMPVELHDIDASLPLGLTRWAGFLLDLVEMSPCQNGIGYLTIDEIYTSSGKSQRRPGLHVDGWYNDGGGGWGGGGLWGSKGLVMVSSHIGCAAWTQEFVGQPEEYGNCEHLRPQCQDAARIELQPSIVYSLGGMTVHECIPSGEVARQFVRLSMPSQDGGLPSNCTPNPLGIKHPGQITVARPEEFTKYGVT